MALPPTAHQDIEAVPARSKIVAAWPVGHFLRNIAILPDGDFVAAVQNRRELHWVTGHGQRMWVSMPASPARLAVASQGKAADRKP